MAALMISKSYGIVDKSSVSMTHLQKLAVYSLYGSVFSIIISKMATKQIYLLGFPCRKLSQRKLPSVRKVLQLFFYKHTDPNLTIRQCFDQVIRDVLKVWKPTGIPVCQPYNAVSKIMKVYREWELLKKNKKKKTQNQKIKEHTFTNRVKNLFDISSRNPAHPLTEAQSKFLNEEWKTSNRHSIFLTPVNLEVSTETLINSDLGGEPNNDCTGTYNMIQINSIFYKY